MSDESILPSGWINAQLGEVVLSITYGHTASASEQKIGPRFLRITDIQDDRVEWVSVPYCLCESVDKYALKAGDIVVARTGATTGKSFLIGYLPEPAVFASYLIRLETSHAIDSVFISWFMRSPSYWSQITSVSKGTAQPGANASTLSELQVPIAPLLEQHRIVTKLEALTAKSRRAKEALDAIPPLLERFRQSVLASAFRGDLTAAWRAKNPDVEPADKLLARIRIERRRRWEEAELAKMQAKGKTPGDDRWKEKYEEPEPVDTEGLPELPEGWGWASIDQLAFVLQYGSSAKTSDDSSGVPVLRMGNILDGQLEPSVLKYLPADHSEFPELLLEPGDILFNRTNSSELVGKSAVYKGSPSPCSFASYLLRVRVVGLSEVLLANYINSPSGRAWIASVVNQQVGQANVNGSKLRCFAVPVPPVDEQRVMIAMIESMMRVQRSAHLQTVTALGGLNELNRSILAKAFRGELVPQDPSDEPASVLLDRLRAERAAGSSSLAKEKKPLKIPKRA